MKVFAKLTAGVALASLVIAQPALAASPRAMNSQATSSAAGKVTGVRASTNVARENNAASGGILIGLVALAAAGAGLYFALDDNDDEPASP